MGQFTYFLPGAKNPTEAVRDAGLELILPSGETITQRECYRGPGGGKGLLLRYGDGLPNYDAGAEHWQQSHNGKYWLGFDPEKPPREKDLRRQVQLDGHLVKLHDEADWLVPLARFLGGGSSLPASLIMGKNGELITEALPRYAGFSGRAEKLWHDFMIENNEAEGELEFDAAGRFNLAVEALVWNYRVGIEEVNALRLLGTDNLGQVMAAVIDVPTLQQKAEEMAASKKKEDPAATADGSSSASGGAD